jgi:hypothetical protein
MDDELHRYYIFFCCEILCRLWFFNNVCLCPFCSVVVGQDEAVATVCNAIRIGRAGTVTIYILFFTLKQIVVSIYFVAQLGLGDASKPIASFLFVGPTGKRRRQQQQQSKLIFFVW